MGGGRSQISRVRVSGGQASGVNVCGTVGGANRMPARARNILWPLVRGRCPRLLWLRPSAIAKRTQSVNFWLGHDLWEGGRAEFRPGFGPLLCCLSLSDLKFALRGAALASRSSFGFFVLSHG